MIALIQKALRPLAVRINNLVARATVALVDDGKGMQLLQLSVLTEETREGVERVQNYGFTSRPLNGAEAVVLFVGGRREHGLAVAVDDRRHRLTDLEPGEVAVYSSAGSRVVLKANGDVEITAAGNVVMNEGSTPVAREGSGTTGHLHTLVGTAGPFPISGTAALQTDTIASGQGSATVKVP